MTARPKRTPVFHPPGAVRLPGPLEEAVGAVPAVVSSAPWLRRAARALRRAVANAPYDMAWPPSPRARR